MTTRMTIGGLFDGEGVRGLGGGAVIGLPYNIITMSCTCIFVRCYPPLEKRTVSFEYIHHAILYNISYSIFMFNYRLFLCNKKKDFF